MIFGLSMQDLSFARHTSETTDENDELLGLANFLSLCYVGLIA